MHPESARSRAWKAKELKCKRRREVKEKLLRYMLPDRVHGRVRLASRFSQEEMKKRRKALIRHVIRSGTWLSKAKPRFQPRREEEGKRNTYLTCYPIGYMVG